MLSAIETAGIRENISYIDIANFSRISIGYMDRFTVMLGSSSDVLMKLQGLSGAVANAEAKEDYDPSSDYSIDTTTETGRYIFTAVR